ncbi:MAG: LytTR family transcriptional regulator DNA-binding domain-containing protein [Bacteroidales bacterium]|nr:LytTR family transcriptional regulator DNA-binding domain-containing protein [Bacteroidales bacterium]
MNTHKIKILIIDDEEPARNLIKTFLQNQSNIEILGECSDGFSAVKDINSKNPDLIFLDIQMPKLTGFEVLELIDNPPLIIFSTAFDDYAVKAFEQKAIDYIMKPYSKARFLEALDKAKEKLNSTEKIRGTFDKLLEISNENPEKLNRFAVKNGSKITILSLEEISLFEAQDDYVMIYSEKGKFMKNMTMKYLEKHLDDTEFVRIHRSFIVNLSCIDKIEHFEKDNYIVILKNKQQAKASKSGYKILKEKLNL